MEFAFKLEGDKTLVTWAMFGESQHIGKLMSILMDCEKMCGPPFEQWLADVARLVTRQAAKQLMAASASPTRASKQMFPANTQTPTLHLSP